MVISTFANAQSIQIKGRVTDAETGDGMPFVNVFFKGTSIGKTTDFDGYYSITTSTPTDSLVASYIGYIAKTKYVNRSLGNQVIDFQLSSNEVKLDEVVVVAGENPAFPIMRNVIKNKDKNDKRSLSAYEYESYNKIEFDIDHLSEKLRRNKTLQKITQVMDSIERIAGEDGKPILPIFISESLSNVYYRKTPQKKREFILKTNITGIGMQDGSLLSQLVGSSFQEYNFYNNWLNILEKDFVSPMADGWKASYDFLLNDSLYVGEHWCYRIDFTPKRVQDLAFSGTMWIESKTYALKQIDVTVGKGANLNFVEKIKIQQELEPTSGNAWLPSRTRVLIDVAEIRDESPGMLAKFYTSNKNFKINQPKDLKFYDVPLELAEDAQQKEAGYWDAKRHDSLTSTEKNVYVMIDSVRNLPTVKTYVEILNIAINGYKKVGPVDVGPYVLAYGLNTVEGHRFQLGFKTNADFSRKWVVKAYAAYGTKDTRLKYSAELQRIISRKPWTIAGIKRRYDLERIGLLTDDIYDNTLLLTASRFGTLRRPFMSTENTFYVQTDVRKGITQRIKLRQMDFNPLYNFSYLKNPEDGDNSPLLTRFSTTELVMETRITKDETFLQNDNERISLGTNKPVISLQYTLGLKGILGGDFSYHKFSLTASQDVRLGILGRSYYAINAAYIPGKLPYPLLFNHLGNQTYFYNSSSYNLMNYFEFSSDQYVSLNYQHNFEGLLFNRIPLMRKLKWRMLATANVLKGSLREENLHLYPQTVNQSSILPPIQPLGSMPYVEVGYGIENIFKFIRIDAVHRLTYLNQPGVRKFGIFVTTQFKL
ncbi:DUF5686 family protein [Rhodocytophaga aerolata]|uniref:DUF5686 family protein n=1 Tax=Rhodocytophaga aerolata TaxID=455078 RepID=A0ABT8RBL5_9BACT|nr:DUF5686 and carboxypeptidase-like regulatory domain-containing protein [Rhodocytophaga aerolata]MDO1448719.1 DUF5686 family protein [Rhodocytophaga aerolata]